MVCLFPAIKLYAQWKCYCIIQYTKAYPKAFSQFFPITEYTVIVYRIGCALYCKICIQRITVNVFYRLCSSSNGYE